MRLLNAHEVADRLNVSVLRAYALLRERRIQVVRIGRQVRVSEEALDEFIRTGGFELPGGWRREPEPRPAA